MKQFLTLTQIARLEDVTRETVGRWVKQGSFPGTRRVGRSYRIPIESYHQWRENTKL